MQSGFSLIIVKWFSSGEYESPCLFEPTDALNGTRVSPPFNVRPPCGLARSASHRVEDRNGVVHDPPRSF